MEEKKRITIIFVGYDDRIHNMMIKELEGECDICHSAEASYIYYMEDGGILRVCEGCMEALEELEGLS
jgi:hypothetical protein